MMHNCCCDFMLKFMSRGRFKFEKCSYFQNAFSYVFLLNQSIFLYCKESHIHYTYVVVTYIIYGWVYHISYNLWMHNMAVRNTYARRTLICHMGSQLEHMYRDLCVCINICLIGIRKFKTLKLLAAFRFLVIIFDNCFESLVKAMEGHMIADRDWTSQKAYISLRESEEFRMRSISRQTR